MVRCTTHLGRAPLPSIWLPELLRPGKGTLRITADLSIETLQARREWQDILKVMKEKNLQLRLLYPARISFKYGRRNQKLYRQAKAERIQHH